MMSFEEQRATTTRIHHDGGAGYSPTQGDDVSYIPIHYWCSGIAACAMNKRVDVCYRGSVEGP